MTGTPNKPVDRDLKPANGIAIVERGEMDNARRRRIALILAAILDNKPTPGEAPKP